MNVTVNRSQTTARGTGGPSNGGPSMLHHVQAALVLTGLIITLVTLVMAISGGTNAPTVVGILATLVAYACIMFFAIRGYAQRDSRFFLVAIYAVAGMLLFKALMPHQTTLTEGLTILAFGAFLLFAERMDDSVQGRRIMWVAIGLLLLEAIVAMFVPLNASLNSQQALMMRMLPWTSVILAGSVALVYSNRS